MKIADLPESVTASKADWLAGTSWLGFTPTGNDRDARNACQSTIQRQFGKGYVIEYITEAFSQPNSGFENDPLYLNEREAHRLLAGRFIAVHKLRATSRPLEDILGPEDFKRLQDMWAQEGKRFRWSVAFPIIESYRIVSRPKAKDVLSDESYSRLYAHSSATLRPMNDQERGAIAELDIEPAITKNAWIGIEDEISFAEQSEIDSRTRTLIDHDLSDTALEGIQADRRARVRLRAAWLADLFVRRRRRENRLFCDECGFNPADRVDATTISLRSILDVHHNNPIEEGIRYTTINDFTLYCPTCHRICHALLRAKSRNAR
jgi:5-methylcytosine-specific restriction protein A